MALSKDSFITLNDGNRIPVLGLGTYAPEDVPKGQTKAGVKAAIEAGFRHIDGAYLYQNEDEVGEAIREKIADGTVKREEIFYTGKLWSTFHPTELVRQGLQASLKALQLDYIDLFLIHCPFSLKPGESIIPMDENGKCIYDYVDLRATWEAMEACKDAGLVKSIGVSNFNRRQLGLILNKPGLKYKPVCNQVECHVYLNQWKMREFCKSKNIVLVAYQVLGSSRDKWIDQTTPVLLDDPVLLKIGVKYKTSSAQIAIRYILQKDIVVLAKSFNPEHIKQNIQVFEFQLAPEDMEAIDGLNIDKRYLPMKEHADSPEFPFSEEY
ncbi:aldo-keto reductase family 1 member C1-like [Lissotriton helveticus]